MTDADVDARLIEEATTPEIAPRLGHRGRPGGRPGRDRADGRAGRRRQAQGRGGAARPRRRQVVGRRRQDRLDRCVHRAAGAATWAGSRPTTARSDEAFTDALFAAEVDTPDRGRRGRGRDLPHRPGHRDRARDRRPPYSDKLENDGIDLAKYRAVVRGDAIRQKLEDKVVADATKPGPQREVQPDLPRARTTGRPARRGRQGPPHPVLAQGRPAGAPGGDIPRDRPGLGRGQGRCRGRLRASSRPTPRCSTRSPERRATRTSARGPTGTGGKLPGYVTRTAATSRSSSEPILAPKPRTARSSPRSSPTSAGTSSRSCTTRPTSST